MTSLGLATPVRSWFSREDKGHEAEEKQEPFTESHGQEEASERICPARRACRAQLEGALQPRSPCIVEGTAEEQEGCVGLSAHS